MRAFVTGGSGFVGQRLIATLREQGHTVKALGRSEAARAEVLRAGAEPCEGDLSSPEALQRGMEGCEVVFHAAAVVKMWCPRAEIFDANVRGTEHVLEAARSVGIQRLVHVSTEAVLMDGTLLSRADETWPLPSHPVGDYASTKSAAERLVLSVNSPGFTTVVVRPRFIWGKGKDPALAAVTEAVRSGRFWWIDGGHYQTSTCHVANCVEGMLLAAEKGKGGQAYFLTDGEPVDFREFMTALLKAQGVEPGGKSLPRWLGMGMATVGEALWTFLRLPGRPPATRAEMLVVGQEVTVSDAKARQELGYTGRMTREKGFQELAQRAPEAGGP
ncbi:NAD-dependent epimerase/dehydratase family protein [Stigmatella aurantiaca]|uniref:NAD dependent epimerase/dehydratase family protein n=1 Tax=Stigmatella aurantiaca (strain DW4/3-1) TaxID=378806 RepID=Q095J3_STIAD|nr:NAD-dependent epimerase/dehydratase family protein [Stigmatella aurantiaca]ADO74280.1 NAD dependent epimerase/dehydratase family protein [Stigmatella aurantiaca DW4/3-1]EAU67392.1 NAD(P)-dependent steroid dehydrogenase [Stigmatella aurantiaca DW4/3-1]